MGYLIALGQIGMEMVVPIGLGVALDVWLGTIPLFIVVGVLLGLVGGMVHMMAILKRMDQSKTKNQSQNST
jgi:F0F1-type ATP synthase assembly protein I